MNEKLIPPDNAINDPFIQHQYNQDTANLINSLTDKMSQLKSLGESLDTSDDLPTTISKIKNTLSNF